MDIQIISERGRVYKEVSLRARQKAQNVRLPPEEKGEMPPVDCEPMMMQVNRTMGEMPVAAARAGYSCKLWPVNGI